MNNTRQQKMLLNLHCIAKHDTSRNYKQNLQRGRHIKLEYTCTNKIYSVGDIASHIKLEYTCTNKIYSVGDIDSHIKLKWRAASLILGSRE
jgi:hypothetical protein